MKMSDTKPGDIVKFNTWGLSNENWVIVYIADSNLEVAQAGVDYPKMFILADSENTPGFGNSYSLSQYNEVFNDCDVIPLRLRIPNEIG